MEDLGLNGAFWKGKRVLITGHTGFKGSWLSLWLQILGAHVSGFALAPPTSPNLFELASVADGMAASEEGDVRDRAQLARSVELHRPEVIIHMAAQSLVRRSYVEPVDTYATNMMGTVHVLDVLRHAPMVRVAIIVTSDKCYENRGWHRGYVETDSMGGLDPYSSSKGCAEIVTSAFRRSYFQKSANSTFIASVRAGNVIGGGDWARDRLVPDMVRAFLKGEAPLIRNPSAVRPWQHVLDPLCGYLMLAERLWNDGEEFAEGWNFGGDPRETKSVASLANDVSRVWGDGANWKADTSSQPHEAAILALDSSKARERLQWAPRLSLEETITWTVDWYRAFSRHDDLQRTTLAQIAGFGAKSGA